MSTEYFSLGKDFEYAKGNLYLKRGFDILFAAFFIVLLSPLFLVCVLAILGEGLISKTARGPAFITQRRISRGQPFNLIKFRSYYLKDDPHMAHLADTIWFINDRRQTWVGKLLRKFYLDELPQLFNVLKGEMSFVGPRPWPEKQYLDVLALGFYARRVVRGGVCGPLQALKGAAPEDKPPSKFEVEDRLVAEYCKRSAPAVVFYDLRLIGKTLKVVWRAEGH